MSFVASLYTLPDIQQKIAEKSRILCSGDYPNDSVTIKCANEIEDKVRNKVFEFLPRILQEKTLPFVRPFLLQIFDWIRYYYRINKSKNFFQAFTWKYPTESICWTMVGTIDKQETVRLCLREKIRNVEGIYRLACELCIEDCIVDLWQQIPRNFQAKYYFLGEFQRVDEGNKLFAYWTNFAISLGNLRSSDTEYEHMVKHSLEMRNVTAFKYFWSKLTDESKTENLARCMQDILRYMSHRYFKYQRRYFKHQATNVHTDMLFFLLSQMKDSEEQKKVFQNHRRVIIQSLIHNWPWQQYLLPTLAKMWEFFEGDSYVDFLLDIPNEIRNRSDLLQNIWRESPMPLKKHLIVSFISEFDSKVYFLYDLLEKHDTGTIRLILSDATREEKVGIAHITWYYFRDVLLHKDLVERFLGLFSAEEIHAFKQEMDINATVQYFVKGRNFEIAEKFLLLWLNSSGEIKQFKEGFLEDNSPFVLNEIKKGWERETFERFIQWGNVYKDIKAFRKCLFPGDEFNFMLNDLMHDFRFEFVGNLLQWYLDSEEEIRLCKRDFLFSEGGKQVLFRFVESNIVHSHKNDNLIREEIDRITQFYIPVDEEDINRLKTELKKEIFDERRDPKCEPCHFPNRFIFPDEYNQYANFSDIRSGIVEHNTMQLVDKMLCPDDAST